MHRLKVIDRILTLRPDEIVCEKVVPDKSPIFDGHFPDYPVVCGALLLEAAERLPAYENKDFYSLELIGACA